MPRTTTIFALGFLGGNRLFLPVIAWLGQMVAEHYADAVMLVRPCSGPLILDFYFRRNQSSEGVDLGSVSLLRVIASGTLSQVPTNKPPDYDDADPARRSLPDQLLARQPAFGLVQTDALRTANRRTANGGRDPELEGV